MIFGNFLLEGEGGGRFLVYMRVGSKGGLHGLVVLMNCLRMQWRNFKKLCMHHNETSQKYKGLATTLLQEAGCLS